MAIALNKCAGLAHSDLRTHLVYVALLPLFMLSEGLGRVAGRLFADNDEAPLTREAWFEHARSQASIATSYALTARRLLQSSERRTRPARLS
jgi:hypothetical protein